MRAPNRHAWFAGPVAFLRTRDLLALMAERDEAWAALKEWDDWGAHITDERSGVTKPMLLWKLRQRGREALAAESPKETP